MNAQSYNFLSFYLREKYNKLLSRFERALSSGRFATYSRQKKMLIWNRLNRYAKQLGLALKPGLITACLAGGICFSSTVSAQPFTVQTGTNNPFNGVDVGNNSIPVFLDIDNDGDLDAFSGEKLGTIKYYKNTGTVNTPIFVEQIGTNNPFNGADVGEYSTPTFVDIDGDGDMDAFIGESAGSIRYYKNTGAVNTPIFVEQIGTNNPFNGVDAGNYISPTFEDMDGDGDKDACIGDFKGTIKYHQNIGTSSSPIFAERYGGANPINVVSVGYFSVPTFVDIDGDGDKDAFIGEAYGTIEYYTNVGTASAVMFVQQVGSSNPFNGVDIGLNATPKFVDIDGDGDQDAFIGESLGTIKYYKNSAISCMIPVFALGTSSTRCQGTETISYAATNATSYSLSNAGTSTINASTGEVTWGANFTGTATITAIGTNCNATHTVTVNPLTSAPSISAISLTSVCKGVNVTLRGTTASEYAWFRNGTFVKYSNTSSDYTFPALVGTNQYSLVAIYNTGQCASVQSTTISVTGNEPVALINASGPTTFCTGNAPILNATPPTGTGYTYSWIGTSPSAATANAATFTPTTSGNHRVIVTDMNGCSKSSAWIPIAVNSKPLVYIGAVTATCVNNPINIGAASSTGLTYSWTPNTYLSNTNVSNPILMPTTTGTIDYTLTVTRTATGCTNTGMISITIANQPVTPSLIGTTSPACQGTSITLTPSGVTGAINWYKEGALNFTASTNAARVFSTVNAGIENYTIRAKVGTCLSEASNAMPVEIKATPIPTLNAMPAIIGNIVSICNPGQTSGTAQLMVNLPSGTPTAASYNWQQLTSGVATNINPLASGNTYTAIVSSTSNNKVFRAQVTYTNGCTKNTANVMVKLLPSTCTIRAGHTEDLIEETFVSYPNPTENVLNIHIQNSIASEGELVLYNTLGQVVTSRIISLSNGAIEESLDVSGLASGVYTLSFQTKEGQKTQKIIKE